jgi:hypothetical protein
MLIENLVSQFWRSLDGPVQYEGALETTGEGALPSVFPVTELAVATIGAAGLAAAELLAIRHAMIPSVAVDRRLASMWFGFSLRPSGWSLPPIWDEIAGDYPTQDGWIKLHTNAPAHRTAALNVLGVPAEKRAVANAVSGWRKDALEAAIVDRGGCAAAMRSIAAWRAHPQGRAVAAEPLFHLAAIGEAARPQWTILRERPLRGIRVLDLTRVLAGPVATRFLAGLGADVLRIDPPGWDEGAVVPEVTLGKRCARLDLRDSAARARFIDLLAQADVLLHGYRPDALAHLGFDRKRRREIRPALIDISLDAYGWTGPWAMRRGFDSFVQMSSGIADAGMRAGNRDRPTPLPVQALDHATGYLLAAAALRGLTTRLTTGAGLEARISLARVAAALIDYSETPDSSPLAPEAPADLADGAEATAWGPARRLRPPVTIGGTPLRWERPANRLGSSSPTW